MGSSSGSSKAGGGAGFLARGEKGQSVQMIDSNLMRESRSTHEALQAHLDRAMSGAMVPPGGLSDTGRGIVGTDADARRAIRHLRGLAKDMGLTIKRPKRLPGALGNAQFLNRAINVRANLSPLAEANVLAHEVAHHVDFRLRGGIREGRQYKGESRDWNATHYRKGEHRAQTAASLYLRQHGINAHMQTRNYTTAYNRKRTNTSTAVTRERNATTGIAAHMLSGSAALLDEYHAAH